MDDIIKNDVRTYVEALIKKEFSGLPVPAI